jgi:hypothetical protein
VFQKNYAMIEDAVVKLIQAEFPDALRAARYQIVTADATKPAVLVRTVDRDQDRLAETHAREVAQITAVASPRAGSHIALDAADAYEWTLYHLLQNEDVIKQQMFPIAYYRANGATWAAEGEAKAVYFDVGIKGYTGNVDDRTLSLINDVPPEGYVQVQRPLADMAIVIRTKDAGINRLTFDIVFNSAEAYEDALRSNVFHRESIAKILGFPVKRVVGSYFVDTCNAIKIAVDRPNISASVDERDVFGAQQQATLEFLNIPIYARALAMASAL